MLIRHGGNHDWYQHPETKICQPIPRHREINENLARHIIRKFSEAKGGDLQAKVTQMASFASSLLPLNNGSENLLLMPQGFVSFRSHTSFHPPLSSCI